MDKEENWESQNDANSVTDDAEAADVSEAETLHYIRKGKARRHCLTVSRKFLENELGKDEPNIEELEKELKVAEQLAAEIVELTQLQRQFLEMRSSNGPTF